MSIVQIRGGFHSGEIILIPEKIQGQEQSYECVPTNWLTSDWDNLLQLPVVYPSGLNFISTFKGLIHRWNFLWAVD